MRWEPRFDNEANRPRCDEPARRNQSHSVRHFLKSSQRRNSATWFLFSYTKTYNCHTLLSSHRNDDFHHVSPELSPTVTLNLIQGLCLSVLDSETSSEWLRDMTLFPPPWKILYFLSCEKVFAGLWPRQKMRAPRFRGFRGALCQSFSLQVRLSPTVTLNFPPSSPWTPPTVTLNLVQDLYLSV